MYDDGPGIGTILAFGLFGGLAFIFGVGLGSGTHPDETALKKKFNELTLSYETLQCSHRGLDLTTVKGITLCMNRETKALHKIDEKAD